MSDGSGRTPASGGSRGRGGRRRPGPRTDASEVRRTPDANTPHAAARRTRLAEARRAVVVPSIVFPEELPVSARRDDIARAIQNHQVIIVSGETGSGKTTQLPKICLQLGRGQAGLIGHTQPRRIAATSTARRIAHELGSPPGEHVGFKIRFNDAITKGASVKLMTDGILLAETQTEDRKSVV